MSFLDPVLNPLLVFHPFVTMLIITLFVTLLITIVYKYTTDQKRMKELKDEQKKVQQELKASKENPDKMLHIQKRAMKSNLEYMKHSLRSTLYTFIPIFLLFGWMNSHLAYYNIQPGQPFTVTAYFKEGAFGTVQLEPTPQLGLEDPSLKNTSQEVSWTLKGSEGEHFVMINYRDEQYKQKILISNERIYFNPVQIVQDSKLYKITTGLKPVRPFDPISVFGWHPNWLWSYILLSILFTTLLRKIMKVY